MPRKPKSKDVQPLDEKFWEDLEDALIHEDGSAAAEHLAAGYPIYICDSSTPKGHVTRVWPSGKREHIEITQENAKNL